MLILHKILICPFPPFVDYINDLQIIMAVSKGIRPSRPSGDQTKIHDELWLIIIQCWAQNAKGRPMMREVSTKVSDPVFLSFSCHLQLFIPDVVVVEIGLCRSKREKNSKTGKQNENHLFSIDKSQRNHTGC